MSYLTRLLRRNYNNSLATINPPMPPNAITTPQELQDYDGSYDAVIWNDIDMGNFGNFTPIANLTHELNGLGYIISNLTISESSDDTGLFKIISSNGYSHNLYFENANVTSTGDYTGALAGRSNGTIEKVGIILGIVNGNHYSGGLVGFTNTLPINCYTTCNVNGAIETGGLVGYSDVSLTNCYATGNVNGNSAVGGLVGFTIGTPTFTNCYATGSVIGTGDSVGGLVGDGNTSTIINSFATGDVNGNANVGGLVGRVPTPPVINCYRWEGQVVTGESNIEGTIVTTDNLYLATWQQANLGFDPLIWDFVDGQLPLIKGMKHQVPILKP